MAQNAGLGSLGAFERGTVIDVRNKRRIYVIDVYRRIVCVTSVTVAAVVVVFV